MDFICLYLLYATEPISNRKKEKGFILDESFGNVLNCCCYDTFSKASTWNKNLTIVDFGYVIVNDYYWEYIFPITLKKCIGSTNSNICLQRCCFEEREGYYPKRRRGL